METTSWIAALERARAELEAALATDPRWSGAGSTDLDGRRWQPGYNLVYRCWAQLNEAIEALRKAQAGPATPARRRVSLREVLQHIRADAEPPRTGPADAGGRGAASAAPAVNAAPAPERAAEGASGEAPEAAEVSFVIREPARAAPAAGDHGSEASAREPLPPRVAPEPPDPDLNAEAEITIVPRRR
jgi:hypothetical protein